MQFNLFTGRLASSPEIRGHGDKQVRRFTLIANEYAGKDENNQARERQVAIPFAAFRHDGQRIYEHCRKGDQLIVGYQIRNNTFEREAGDKVYSFDFVVTDVEFGAPGPEKRAEFERQSAG